MPTTFLVVTSLRPIWSQVTLLSSFVSRPSETRIVRFFGWLYFPVRRSICSWASFVRPFNFGLTRPCCSGATSYSYSISLAATWRSMRSFTMASYWRRINSFSSSVCSCWARWMRIGGFATRSKRIAPPLSFQSRRTLVISYGSYCT